jgi:hypothetical protein
LYYRGSSLHQFALEEQSTTVYPIGVRSAAGTAVLTVISDGLSISQVATPSHRLAGAGRGRTTCGHQNQRPSSAAIDGVMNALITKVSNNRPNPIVVPTWATTTMALTDIDIMVNANTRPAAVTTDPLPPMARMIPVLIPAGISSFIRATNSRL